MRVQLFTEKRVYLPFFVLMVVFCDIFVLSVKIVFKVFLFYFGEPFLVVSLLLDYFSKNIFKIHNSVERLFCLL
jgi:hypothetical protein